MASAAKGKLLEQVVAKLHAGENVKVATNVRLPTRGDPKRKREIDVLLSGGLAGHEIRIAVECKNYRRAIGAPDLDAFVGKLHDIGIDASLGIYVATSRFTSGAIKRAEKDGVRTFVLSGLADDGLSLAVEEAVQSVIYLVPVFAGLELKNDLDEVMDTPNMVMYENERGEMRLLPDVVWLKWISGEVPSSIGIHEVDCLPDCPVFQVHRGRKYRVMGAMIRVHVVAVTMTLRGHGLTVQLVSPTTGRSVRGQVEVVYERAAGRMPFRAYRSEEELQAGIAGTSARYSATIRQRVPRIRVGPFYWPYSRRFCERILELGRARGLESFDEALREVDPREVPETWLEAAYDEIVPGYTGGWSRPGEPHFGQRE